MITWKCAGCGLTAFDKIRRCECATNVVIPSDAAKAGCRSAWKVNPNCGSEACRKRIAALEAAAHLGLEMARANDLWNTAEEIEQALAVPHSN